MSKGVVYGDYFLLGRLAKGGMAEVFLAKRLATGEGSDLLAVKRTLPQFAANDEFSSMFVDEARIARALAHPNICRIIDHGQVGTQLFIVMEFIHGKDLRVVQNRAIQRGEPIPYRFAAFALAQIAKALDFAHSLRNERGEPENIVHRDISPQNILVSYDGVPKLIDFGIAKAKDRIAQTRVGVVKGKFAYMSPEQAMAGEVDWRTDLFALGVTLYELVTGQLPFKGSSDFSTLKRIARGEYKPPDEIHADIPLRLIRIIERALERDVNARYQSGMEMAHDIERMLLDEGRIDAVSFSSYLRKLFRDDYIRETSRIRQFEAIEPPAEAVAKANKRRRRETISEEVPLDSSDVHIVDEPDEDDLDDELEFEEPTIIAPSPDLAAGFDAEVTGLNQLLEPEPIGDEPTDRNTPLGRGRRISGRLEVKTEEVEPITTDDFDIDAATGGGSAGAFSRRENTVDDPVPVGFEDTSEEDDAPEQAQVDFFDEATQEARSLRDLVGDSPGPSIGGDTIEFVEEPTEEHPIEEEETDEVPVKRPKAAASPRAEAMVAEIVTEFEESTRELEPEVGEYDPTRVDAGGHLMEEARRAAEEAARAREAEQGEGLEDGPTEAVDSQEMMEAVRQAIQEMEDQDRIEAEIASEGKTKAISPSGQGQKNGGALEISEPEFTVPSDVYVIETKPPRSPVRSSRPAAMLTSGELTVLVLAALLGAGVVLSSYYVASRGLPEFARDFLEKIVGPSQGVPPPGTPPPGTPPKGS